ncbi:MAG: transposase [Marinovum algicola]
MEQHTTYVTMDTSEETIAVAVAEGGTRGEVRWYGTISSLPEAVTGPVGKLARWSWGSPGSVDTIRLWKESVRMPRTRTPYPAEYREQIVALARTGRSPEDLAREFEPCAATIHGWIKQADCDGGRRADVLSSEEREELQRLRRENRQLNTSGSNYRPE